MEDIDPFKSDPDAEEESPQAVDVSREAEQQPEPTPISATMQQRTQSSTSSHTTLPGPLKTADPPLRLRDDLDKKDSIQIVDAQKTNEGATSSYIAYLIRSEVSRRV